VLGKYKNYSSLVKCKCNICSHEWNARPNNLLKKRNPRGCPKCGNIKKGLSGRLSPQEFENRTKHLNITFLTPFTKTNEYIRCKCNSCNNEWNSLPSNIFKDEYMGCTHCNPINKTEFEVFEYIKNNLDDDIIVENSYTPKFMMDDPQRSSAPQHYDIFLPKYNIAIEINGEQHFYPVTHFGGVEKFKLTQWRDKRKRQISKDNKITLIYVNYNVFNYKTSKVEKIRLLEKLLCLITDNIRSQPNIYNHIILS